MPILCWRTNGILPYSSAPASFKRLLDGGPFTTAWLESRHPGGGDAVGVEGIRGSPRASRRSLLFTRLQGPVGSRLSTTHWRFWFGPPPNSYSIVVFCTDRNRPSQS